MLKYIKCHRIIEAAPPTNPQGLFDIIKLMLTGSDGSFTTFLTYINKSFSISNMRTMSKSVLSWSNDMTKDKGFLSKIFTGFYHAMSKAIEFSANMTKAILQTFPQLNNQAFNSQFTYGTLLGMVVVAACCLYVFNNVCKVIRRKFYESTSDNSIILYAKLGIQKSIVESDLFFNKLCRVVDKEYLTEGSIMITFSNIISSAWNICRDMLEWISSIVSSTTYATSDFVNKHPKFVTCILMCIGMLLLYNRCPSFKRVINDVIKQAK